MSPCEFNQEDFCTFQLENPKMKKCSLAKGKLQKCMAQESDLIELCPDCEKPTSECDCGTCWVLASDKNGNIALLKPKEFAQIKNAEKVSE